MPTGEATTVGDVETYDGATAAVLAALDQGAVEHLVDARPQKTRASYARDRELLAEFHRWLAGRTGHTLPPAAVTKGTLVASVIRLDRMTKAALSTIDRRITGVTVTARRHGTEVPKQATRAAREALKPMKLDPVRTRGRGKAIAATPAHLKAMNTSPAARPQSALGRRRGTQDLPELARLRDRALATPAFGVAGRSEEVSSLGVVQQRVNGCDLDPGASAGGGVLDLLQQRGLGFVGGGRGPVLPAPVDGPGGEEPGQLLVGVAAVRALVPGPRHRQPPLLPHVLQGLPLLVRQPASQIEELTGSTPAGLIRRHDDGMSNWIDLLTSNFASGLIGAGIGGAGSILGARMQAKSSDKIARDTAARAAALEGYLILGDLEAALLGKTTVSGPDMATWNAEQRVLLSRARKRANVLPTSEEARRTRCREAIALIQPFTGYVTWDDHVFLTRMALQDAQEAMGTYSSGRPPTPVVADLEAQIGMERTKRRRLKLARRLHEIEEEAEYHELDDHRHSEADVIKAELGVSRTADLPGEELAAITS
ncbi:hypothetical protein [Streptomyces clavifer]|uniref:hypothetical protein n=1 Tax=Streptomyces clavifer TaxID=68188 RepID=UPI0033AA4E64